MMKYRLIPCVLCLLSLCTLPAQEAEAPPRLKTSFSVFPLEAADWKGIYYAPNGNPADEATPIEFNQLERSILYPYDGPAPLTFFRKYTNPEAETVWIPVAITTPGTGDLPHDIILFFSPAKTEGRFDVNFMPDTPETFPDESIVFFNTLNIPLVGVLNDSRILAPPGLSTPLDVSSYFEKSVPIAMAIHHQDDLHLVLRNQIRFSPERRTLIILRPPQREGSIRIRTQRLTEYTGKEETL
jgi:hypothetical protein